MRSYYKFYQLAAEKNTHQLTCVNIDSQCQQTSTNMSLTTVFNN